MKKCSLPFLLTLTLLFCAAGCDSTLKSTDDTPTTYRGLLVLGHESRELTLCGESTSLWIIDTTQGDAQEIYESFPLQSYEPIFVEIRGDLTQAPKEGFGANYPAAIVMKQIVHASMPEESWGCREKYANFAFKAQGNEPDWTATVKDNGIIFKSISLGKELQFPLPIPVAIHNSITYSTDSDEHSFKLSFKEGRCRSTMSGEIFGWTATLALGGTTYTGCAKRGDQ